MSTVTLKGTPFQVKGHFPTAGEKAKDFTLVKTDLSEMSLGSLKGRKVVMNIFPSLDTPVCAMSVRRFNQMAGQMKNTVVLAISKDLPFAHRRFCSTEGIENVTGLSAFRNPSFAEAYGVDLAEGPMAGLLSRSVIIVNEEGKVIYSELVPEIAQEPDYEAALKQLE